MAAAAVASAAAAMSCAPRTRPPATTDSGSLAAAQAAMLPTRLAIHPLTHVGADPNGQPALLLYVELSDRFGQNSRALGTLHVGVRPPGAIDASDGGSQWDIDLRDPDQNALLFDDLITRTYALTLTGLPAWLTEWAAAGGSPGGGPTVSATFRLADPRGQAPTGEALSDSVRLGK
jgi:hypothetical protein